MPWIIFIEYPISSSIVARKGYFESNMISY